MVSDSYIVISQFKGNYYKGSLFFQIALLFKYHWLSFEISQYMTSSMYSATVGLSGFLFIKKGKYDWNDALCEE